MIWNVEIAYTGITKRRRRGEIVLEAGSATEARTLAVMWFKGQHPEMPRNRVRALETVGITSLPDSLTSAGQLPAFFSRTQTHWRREPTKNGRSKRWKRVTPKTVITRKFDDNGEPL